MIEKLDPIKHTDNLYDRNGFITNVACGGVVIKKVNELIDTVNELGKDVLFLRKKVLELGYKEPKPAENVQDDYAQYRKWVGKLCRFWDDGCASNYISLLKQIDDDETPFADDKGVYWQRCEPVKPDDDIIYKGE